MSAPSNVIFAGPGTYAVAVTTTGSAGSATGTATFKGLRGLLTGRNVNWHASAPAGTSDITIVEANDAGSVTLYTKTNSVTDNNVPFLTAAGDNAGAAITDQYIPITLRGGTITVTVSQSDALTDCAIVELTVV
jgi:hypothetical protein